MSNRVIIGQFPDGGYGMRISEPGYDVLSNPIDPERLIFNSDWDNTVNIAARGSVTIAPTANSVTVALASPVNIPVVVYAHRSSLAAVPNRDVPRYAPIYVSASGSYVFINQVTVSKTNIVFYRLNPIQTANYIAQGTQYIDWFAFYDGSTW